MKYSNSQLYCAFVCPFSAASKNHFRASMLSCLTPVPFKYISPSIYCAFAYPWVAAHFDQPALVSLKTGEGLPALLERLSSMMLDRTRRMKLRLPQSAFGLMSLIHEQGKVISQDYDGNDILLDIIMPRRFDSQLEPHLDPPLPARVPEAWEAAPKKVR